MKKLIAIILVCATLVFAEQIAVYNTPSSEYCIRIIDDDGDVWDKDANTFTVLDYNDPNGFTDLDEDVDDSNTPGRYYTTFPPEISAGTYDVLVYDSNVADVNAVTDYDGGFAYDWDGADEVTEQMIAADTNELQTDWADGGRLDLLIDDIPNNSEVTDMNNSIMVDIAELNDPNITEINNVVVTALVDYNSPTYAEFITRTVLSDDYFDPNNDIVDSNVTQIDEDTNSVTRLKNRR